MNEELKAIVQRMIDAGEPEENIKLVIQSYSKEPGKSTDPASSDTDSGSENGSLEPVKIVEGKGMFAGETEISSSFGGLIKKVKNTKDFVKGIFNTQDSVKEDDEKVTSRAAEKYFSLDAMPKRELKPYDGESDFREFENTLEEDLEAYFNSKESLEKGINKYEEYKKWDGGNGELPKHIRFKSDVEVEQKNRKRELTEEYIAINVPEDKQVEAYLALPSVVGDEKEVVINGKTYKNPKELYNTLKKRDAERGTTKAIDFEADYLAASNEGFNNDYENYEKDLAKYEKDNEPILKQQALLVDKFKKLGKVDENSSEQEISEYNALVVENNNLQDQLDQSGANTLIETQKSLKNRFDDLISKADTFENTSMAATALGLDYSLGGRVSLQLEKTFLAGGAVLGAGTMKLLGKLGEVKYPTQQDIKIQEALAQNYKNAINYYDEVGKEIETTLPTTIKVEDINSGNVFEAAKQMLGNNAPSILVALGTSGTGAFLTRGLTQEAAMQTRRKMANLGMGIFFEMEAGGKLGDIEVGEKYAAANIDALNAMLERDKKEGIVKTPDEILSIKQQISDNENALSFTGMQKAFSTVMYGGIASYAERLGTLRYMNGLTKTSKVYGAGLFKKTIRGAKGNIYNVGVELIEETATQLGHNLTDITVLGENKSMIEGLDADFLVNTAFTSLAIQGPSMGMNSYNALKGEVITRQEREESRARTQEVLQIQNELNSTSPLNFEKRRELTKRKLELLQEAEITDVQVVQKISRMTSKEVTDLFEANRLKREALKNLQELGGDIDSNSEFNKKQKERLIEEYNRHEGKRELLLGKLDDRNKKTLEAALKIAGLEKGVDYNLEDEAEMAFQLGKYQLNQDVLKNIVGADNVKIFKGEDSKQQLEEYLKQKVKDNVISQEDADKALQGNKNAMFIGSEYVLMEDVALQGITVGGASALFAASSPLHELLHRDLIEAGIVVDGKIVKSAEDVVASIEDHLNSLSKNDLIDKNNAKIIKNRIEQYKSKEGVDLEELITLVGDLKDQGVISRETMSLNYDLKRFIKLTAGKLLGDKNAFLGFNTIEDIFRYIDSFQNRAKDQTLVIPPDEKEEAVEVKQSKAVDKRTPEQLVKIIQRGGNPKKVKEAEDALAPQFELLALSEKALNYDTRKGDIAREDVVAEAMTYLPGIVKRYNKKDGAFSTFVIANMRPKQQVIYEKVKPLTYGETTSTDTKEARQIEDTSSETTNTEDTFVQKINILQDFAIANRVADKIKALVKVAKGDNFKSIISKYAGKVGELIFEIPAKKIMEGGANLAAVTKYTEGMPAPAEAQNIQRFFNAPNNADKFIKTLPLYNVTDKTADINKVGENLDVSRDTYGYAIGLKGLPLDYFYENYTDPTGEITSPKGRSKGLTSQTQVKRLKPQFRKPTPEVVEQFKKDLGITPKNEANVYSRDIGQLLKGVAKVHSINAAISGAQRFQEAKTKAAPITEQKAIKQQTANITAAQSKIAFSEAVLNDVGSLFVEGITNPNFNLDLAGARKMDTLLVDNKLNKTLDLKKEIRTVNGRENILNNFKWIMANLGPREMWFGKQGKNKFTTSGADYSVSMSKYSKKDLAKGIIPKDKKVGDYKDLEGREALLELRKSINNLGKKDSGFEFGKPIKDKKGKILTDYSVSSYSTLLGDPKKTKFKKKEIAEFNEKVSLIHEAMWSRINNLVVKDKKNAPIIGTYLKLVANHTGHWHKIGAQIAGWSKNPVGVGDTLYEYEHAMPATAAYLYLMHTILDKKANFKPAYKAVMNNYKLIALDKAQNKKLGLAKLGRSMPVGWRLDKNFWWQRYFNEVVEQFDNGIDPNSIVGLDGKTFGEMFNIKKPITKENLSKTNKLNKAIAQGRKTVKESKGITVLDFDDTLATSKSLVISTSPDGVVRKLTAEEFAQEGADLLDQGWTHDFSEFSKVVDGKVASLFKKAMKLQGKFGPENMFVLTARPADSAPAIFEFLKANGLNIPLKNITGLANSTAEAKALWIADKVGEGYNDFYFADDALQNVQAVDDVLNQLGVKRKVQQAKVKFSKSLGKDLAKNKNYKKFRNSLKGSVLYHGGTASLSDNKAVWFTASDFNGAELYAERRDGKIYSINSNNLNNAIIIPDVSDLIGLEKIIKNKYKSIAKEVFDEYGQVDIKKVLETDVASEVIYDFMDYVNNNFELLDGVYGPETLYDNDGKISKGVPVIVLGGNVSTKVSKVKFSKSIQTIPAVANMLDEFDVKRKVQQARLKFSKDINTDFNNILEEVTGIEAKKRFSDIKARKRGASKGKFRVFVPPSHEDFVGLLYNFMGKGRKGDSHRDFFEKALVKPLNRAYREIDTAKQAVANDYKSLNKQFPDVKKKLIKNTPDGDFTFQDAIRVYLWDKHGYKIPGLSETDQTKLAELVVSDPQLQAYAETLNVISKQETYVDPGPSWETANIRIDLVDATGRVGRAGYFAEFNENAEVMFSEENLNKIEAAYGKDFREALEDMLHAIKTGINRPKGSSAAPNMFLNWLNASVSGVMFFNTRSSILQQMSIVNYLNFADNNMYTAGKAFANQKQYWKDFAMIFNSDMLKQRRGGIGTDINGAELAEAIKKARPGNLFDQVAIITGKALKLGFLPTQIGDNIAIAVGGAAFYRNRVNTYLKQGMSQKEAEAAAFTDFQDITQSTQQSSRPDMTSQQQRSWIGKLILNFQNITSQYNRLMKKAALDIKNKRISPPYTTRTQSNLGNLSKILYYGAVQNVVFYSLQTALFAVMFDDDEDKDQIIKKKERVIQGTIDSILRGTGIYGAIASTLKNMVIKFREQREKKYNKDESAVLMEGLNLSPVVGIRARGIVNAEKTLNYNKKVIKEMETFDIDNPVWSAVTNVIQVAGFPANRMYQKTINIRNSLDNQYTGFQRALFFSGFTTWSLGLGDTEKMKQIKQDVKDKTKAASKEKARIRKEEKKKEKEEENKAVIEQNKKKSKKDGLCSAVSKGGKRCKNKAINDGMCTIHEKAVQRKDGKQTQCIKRKSNGKRCGMKTSSKSGLCYYHD